MAAPPSKFQSELPDNRSDLTESYYYLSANQKDKILRRSEDFRGDSEILKQYAPFLPGWVPWRDIAKAMGFDESGIEQAEERFDGPAVWGTEFENVHVFWDFEEPGFTLENGDEFSGSEQLYQLQKAGAINSGGYHELKQHFVKPCTAGDAFSRGGRGGVVSDYYDGSNWGEGVAEGGRRDEAMKVALKHKFRNDSLEALLMSTKSHRLVSIKGDSYWGFAPKRSLSGSARSVGNLSVNKLATLLEERRAELLAGNI